MKPLLVELKGKECFGCGHGGRGWARARPSSEPTLVPATQQLAGGYGETAERGPYSQGMETVRVDNPGEAPSLSPANLLCSWILSCALWNKGALHLGAMCSFELLGRHIKVMLLLPEMIREIRGAEVCRRGQPQRSVSIFWVCSELCRGV